MPTAALHFNRHVRSIGVTHHQVNGTHRCGVLPAHQLPPLTKNLRDLLGEELLQVSLHAVFHEAGVHSQILRDVSNDVVDAND